ncbi:MAG: RCC1 domain-containing protein, partial [Polyangiaceae bacterium]
MTERARAGQIGKETGLSNVVELAAHNSSSCARLGDGTMKCWGWNISGQLGDHSVMTRLSPVTVCDAAPPVGQPCAPLSNVAALAQGPFSDSACALMADGTVRCWGANGYGQLGNGTMMSSAIPVPVPGVAGAKEVSLGQDHMCILMGDGTVQCVGENNFGTYGAGALGDGTT